MVQQFVAIAKHSANSTAPEAWGAPRNSDSPTGKAPCLTATQSHTTRPTLNVWRSLKHRGYATNTRKTFISAECADLRQDADSEQGT